MLDWKVVLLLVDIQTGFDAPAWGRRNNPRAEENAARMLDGWRNSYRPVIHVRHLSRDPDSPLAVGAAGSRIKPIVGPQSHEGLVEKSVNSAFIGTNLEPRLSEIAAVGLVIAGLTTDHCISSTARMAGNLGFDTYVVSDATATFDRRNAAGDSFSAEDVHEVSLASLNDEFASVVTTDDLLSWIR